MAYGVYVFKFLKLDKNTQYLLIQSALIIATAKKHNCSEIVKSGAFLLRAVTHGDFNHPCTRMTASIQWLMSIKYLIVHYDCIAD